MNKEMIIEDLLEIIENNVELLSKKSLKDLKGINHLYSILYEEEDDKIIENNLTLVLDSCIDILTGIEDELSDEEKENFNDWCTNIIAFDKMGEFYIGQPVVYEGEAWVIGEIDYDEFGILLYSGQMGDNGFWIESEDILNLK